MNLYEIEKIRNDQKFHERFPPEFMSEIYPTYILNPIIKHKLKNKSKKLNISFELRLIINRILKIFLDNF